MFFKRDHPNTWKNGTFQNFVLSGSGVTIKKETSQKMTYEHNLGCRHEWHTRRGLIGFDAAEVKVDVDFLLKIFISSLSVIFAVFGFSERNVIAQPNEVGTQNDIELSYEISKSAPEEMRIEFKLTNKGTKTLFIATNPQNINGLSGYYVEAGNRDTASVVVSTRVYRPLVYSPYAIQTRVEMKKLEPNEFVFFHLSLPSLVRETVPPTDLPLDIQELKLDDIKRIDFQVGYFRDEKGVTVLLDSKALGWFVNGNEKLLVGEFAGKRLFEVQELVTISVSLIESKSGNTQH